MPCNFTYSHYREIFQAALEQDYQIITLTDWFRKAYSPDRKLLINRVDIDDNIHRMWVMADIFRDLDIRASIYLRLHAPGYNLLFFDNVNLVRRLLADGHELGLHSEIEDMRHICGLDPEQTLRAELALFADLLGTTPHGVASHGGRTPYNNLDFWKDRGPAEFGLLYEAYDPELWEQCRYVSDSEFTRWKAYEGGALLEGDRRCPCRHFVEGPPLLYLLTHTCSYYEKHIGEQILPVTR